MSRKCKKEYLKEYRVKHKERLWKAKVKCLYGLDWSDYLQLKEATKSCPICGSLFGDGNVPCIDHDHATGRVRGLLCRKCNTGLGAFGDSVQVIAAAMRYLSKE